MAKFICLCWSQFKGPKQGSKSTLIRSSGCMEFICTRVEFSKRSLGVRSTCGQCWGGLRIYGKLVSDKNNCKRRTERMRCYRGEKKERTEGSSDLFSAALVPEIFSFSKLIFSKGISNNSSTKETKSASSRVNHNIRTLQEGGKKENERKKIRQIELCELLYA